MFRHAGDVVRLGLLGAGVGALPGALLAAAANVAWLGGGSYWPKVATWWSSDALGVILLSPFLLTWVKPAEPRSGRTVEALALLGLLTAAGWGVFATTRPSGLDAALPFFLLPLIAWPALRLGARGATAATVILDLIATWHTTHEHGPFAMLSVAVGTRILNLQLYIAFLNLFVLILAVVVVKEQQARAAAQRAEQRARFLAAASESLSASLDSEEILSALPQLCVQSLADWCVLDVIEDNGLRRLGGAHRDPSKRKLLDALSERYSPDSRSPQPAARVLRTGEPLLLPQTTDETLRSNSVDDENARLIRELGTHTAMAVPLAVRGKMLGVLTLASADPGVQYGPSDIVFVDELGRRAASALENARLYADVQRAEAALRQANEELEQRVEERTRELKQAQARLVDTARAAGMAEVASNVLHNVGNVLTSAVVNLETMRQAVGASRVGPVEAGHGPAARSTGSSWRTSSRADPRGHRLPDYLSALAESCWTSRPACRRAWRRWAGTSSTSAPSSRCSRPTPKTVADHRGVRPGAARRGRAAHPAAPRSSATASPSPRELSPLPRVRLDKHKVLQILINLISNAKYAMDAIPEGQRPPERAAQREGDSVARIQVADNGMGIAPEMRERLFPHGFTTRKDGHGFGLHSSALAAQLLGGRLTLESEGPGKGATATLELPLP